MPVETAAALRGPTALAARAVGPDLSRGAMLLLIALANAHAYLFGREVGVRGYPEQLDRLDAVVTWLLMTAVDGRAYPFFGLLFGYGLVQLLRRLERAGQPRAGALSLLRRRGGWLVLLGLLHAVLLFSGDILGAYGLLAVLVAGVVLRSSDRVLLLAAACCSVLVVALAAGQGVPAPSGTDSFLPSLGTADPARALGYRVVEWLTFTLFGAGIVAPAVLVGAWAGRRGLLDRPERQVSLLRTGAASGLAVGLVGAQPSALAAAQVWQEPSAAGAVLAAVLHTVTGFAAGAGYACLGGLVAVRLAGRRGPVATALVATGQRSLTCYLAQSAVFVALLASYGGGLGDDLGVAEVTGVALLTWLGTVLLAVALARAGRRGPFEALLRRLTYGPPRPAPAALGPEARVSTGRPEGRCAAEHGPADPRSRMSEQSPVDDVWDGFREAVNMTPRQLEDWLETDESKAVGQKDGDDDESTGHASGRRIVQLLRTQRADLSEDDAAHMRKVVGYVARHTAQRPDKSDDELAHAKWTASLKNWGHDPLA